MLFNNYLICFLFSKKLFFINDSYFFIIGLEAISKGEVAALVLAGGQASRLGANVPKGAFNLEIGFSETDSLFYIQAAKLCTLKKLAAKEFPGSKSTIPWFIFY